MSIVSFNYALITYLLTETRISTTICSLLQDGSMAGSILDMEYDAHSLFFSSISYSKREANHVLKFLYIESYLKNKKKPVDPIAG